MKRTLAFISAILLMSTCAEAACRRQVIYYPSSGRVVVQSSGCSRYTVSKNYGTTSKTTWTTQNTTQNTTSSNQTQTTQVSASTAEKILELVNKQRAAYGLSALKLDAALSKTAQAKAEDMQRNNYFSHTSPTYGSPFDMMKSFGISYRTAGENIAKGQKSEEAVMNAWMNSEGHRKNILGSSYTRLGVGYVNKNGTTYWVQMFVG